MSFSPSRIFYLYAAFLLVSGVVAFALAGFEPKAKTALIMGGGCAVAITICAYFGRTRPLAILVGRLLSGLFLFVFSWRAYKIRDVPEKAYLLNMFGALIAASATAIIAQAAVASKKSESAKQQQD